MDGKRFDTLARRLTLPSSRRTAVRGVAAGLTAALASTLGGSVAPEEAEAATDQVCRNQAVNNNKQCPASPADSCSATNIHCECWQTVNDDIRCINTAGLVCPSTDECDRNAECGAGQVCVKTGGCCCPEGIPQRRRCKRRHICVPLCTD
jgi:hypothetical protein